jgi:hypothetical protein
MVPDDLADGAPKKRHFSVIPAAPAVNQELQNKLAGEIEMDDA